MADSWDRVDAYIGEKLIGDDEVLAAALAHNAENGLPPIDVSAAQGKMLYLLAQMAGARRILEIGTLGGYSTIWLARALPDDGALVTLEVGHKHARVAQANLDRAGLSDRAEIRVGPALDSLAAMTDVAPFDFVFIDADKQSNVDYVAEAIRLGRSGTTIIVDNVVREGGILDPASNDPGVLGTRALFDFLQSDPRIDATAVQTVGAKGWDGFVLARVV
ncbi:O-methyltransferase [Sphingopyxis sp.]|jgi:predicted O-methyltransferase YrrM|uniref:O-methyltransferase n=1 Tax=Sphingopyxis sp. TaxID=1908224 RepID=UPI00311DD68D